MKPRFLPRLLVRGCFVSFGLAIGALGAELGLRWLRPQPVNLQTPGMYEPVPPTGYRLLPGFVGTVTNRTEFSTTLRINRDGLRGADRGPTGDRRLRILGLGDSFAFGYGVEENEAYIQLLPALLTAAGHPAIGLNGGVPGYAVPQAADWLDREGLSLGPDVVVLGLYLGNDLQDADPESPPLRFRERDVYPGGAREWLYRHSHLFVFLKHATPSSTQARIRAFIGLGEPSSFAVLRAEMSIYRTPTAEPMRRGLSTTAAALAHMHEVLRARGVPLLVMLIPHVVQVDRNRLHGSLQQLGESAEALDIEHPNRLVQAELEAQGIPALDLRPLLVEATAAGQQLYFNADPHLNRQGHELAAQALARWMLDFKITSAVTRPAAAATPTAPAP